MSAYRTAPAPASENAEYEDFAERLRAPSPGARTFAIVRCTLLLALDLFFLCVQGVTFENVALSLFALAMLVVWTLSRTNEPRFTPPGS